MNNRHTIDIKEKNIFMDYPAITDNPTIMQSNGNTKIYGIFQTDKDSDNVSFEKWTSKWIEWKTPFLKNSSLVRYINIVNKHLIPYFKNYSITEIDTVSVQKFIHQNLIGSASKPPISPKSASDILIVLKGILKYANKIGNLNTCNVSDIKTGSIKYAPRYLTDEEYRNLLQQLHRDMTRIKAGIFISLCTGLRIGEICALKCGDISVENRTIHVRKTMQRLQKIEATNTRTSIIITNPKTQKSIRDIPIPSCLIPILEKYKGNKEAFFLTGKEDKFIEPRTMQNHFKKYATEAEIYDATFHTLRHTFATRCIELGIDYKTLSELLGHSDVTITLNLYVHSTMKHKIESIEKISRYTENIINTSL